MALEAGRVYTKTELADALGVTSLRWDKLGTGVMLRHLRKFCEVEELVSEKDRRKKEFYIHRIFGPFRTYSAPKQKKDISKNRIDWLDEMLDVLEGFKDRVIKEGEAKRKLMEIFLKEIWRVNFGEEIELIRKVNEDEGSEKDEREKIKKKK